MFLTFGVMSEGESIVGTPVPAQSAMVCLSLAGVIPRAASSFAAILSLSPASPRSKCSDPIYVSPNSLAHCIARLREFCAFCVNLLDTAISSSWVTVNIAIINLTCCEYSLPGRALLLVLFSEKLRGLQILIKTLTSSGLFIYL